MSQQQQQTRSTEPADTRVPCPENTIFLIPDLEYDARVINLYLKKKYKNIPAAMITNQVNSNMLAFVTGLQFVVCVRRAQEDQSLGPDFEYVEDKNGKTRMVPIKHETYISDVVESAPVKVSEYVKVQPASMFQQTETNLKPLIQALGDAAYPFRVTSQNKPDFMIRCVVAV